MKTIVDDPEGFFEQGGWSFLDPESEVHLGSPHHLFFLVFLLVKSHILLLREAQQGQIQSRKWKTRRLTHRQTKRRRRRKTVTRTTTQKQKILVRVWRIVFINWI